MFLRDLGLHIQEKRKIVVSLQLMKQLLAIMLFFIFAMQVLPVKALGRLLCKAQTEDVSKYSCDSNDDDDAANLVSYPDFIVPVFGQFTVAKTTVTARVTSFRYSATLPQMHVADIPSPPPNC